MRLTVINCILLACAASTLAEEPRPRRHLHQIKELIVNKLLSSSEPNCSQSNEPTTAPLPIKFFRIPGFNNVVVKAVPKGSIEVPIYEKLPPNSDVGIIGSYLGTSTLNETYNALLGVKNLLTSGILNAKRDVLQHLNLAQPPKVQIVAVPKAIKPCAAPAGPPPLEPIRILVKPPKVPVVPTQYSYKQVNQDGSLTTYTSSLSLENGIRVIEDGKTIPFFIDRIQKVPVTLPVPVLPEVAKIFVSEVVHPGSTYSYQQIHQDGRTTSYMGLPTLVSLPGPVIVTETGMKMPPPPVFLMDRIEKVAAIAAIPKAPLIDVASKPVVMNAPVAQGSPLPGPVGYSYSQMNINGGMTTHSASGASAAVLVTDNELPAAPLNAISSLPEKNPFGYSSEGYSYMQVHGGGKTSTFNGGNQAANVIEHKPLPQNSYLYKQIGDGKITTYTGSSIYEEMYDGHPAVIVRGMDHPIPPPHLTDRIEKVAAGAMYNRPPFSMPIAVPVPTDFVRIPQVLTSVPQRPVKIPHISKPSPFMYKHIHSDGSMTSFGANGLSEDKPKSPSPANIKMPFPQGNVRIFESPMYSGLFPINPVNSNAVKPSTPVSSSYSYKMVNSGMGGSHPPVGPNDGPIIDTFAAPPPLPSIPAPVEACIDPDIVNPDIGNPLGQTPLLFENPMPLTYSYKQISHSNPDPFLVVNVKDPAMDMKKENMIRSQNSQGYQPLAPLPPPVNPFPASNVIEHRPPASVQPAPFAPPPIVDMPVPQVPMPTPSSFSYKQVTSQAYQPMPAPLQPAVSVVEHKPMGFVEPTPFLPPPMIAMPLPQFPPPPQPAVNVVEHKPVPIIPPPKINMRAPQIKKDNALPSSFSYKQVTSQGLYEYSDEFPSGVKTNLPPNMPNPQGNPSGNVYVNEKPMRIPSFPMPVPVSPISILENPVPMPVPAIPRPVPARPMLVAASPLPIPASPLPVLARPVPITSSKPAFSRDSLASNPIVVPEQSSFSFKSSNPDGSTITVKGDGHSGMAVHVEEAPEESSVIVSQEPMIPIPPEVQATKEPMVPVLADEVTTSASEQETTGQVSGHAKPVRRRVMKRKMVKHRGDIPDAAE